ncbi:MAG: hypothetical protein M1825_001360 [Sarcosagium campestre]|nr:MAG: hypothetical protein M1825_001360 [Sarcosagium campestre]
MLFASSILLAVAGGATAGSVPPHQPRFGASELHARDDYGYITPFDGTASTTFFDIGSTTTSCGITAATLPKGQNYIAINQLGFGANPNSFVNGQPGGGAGGACGQCFEITPLVDGKPATDQTVNFMIVDECPADPAKSEGHTYCTQCGIGWLNHLGENWHFDVMRNNMNPQDAERFFRNVDQHGGNWEHVQFTKSDCGSIPRPAFTGDGCGPTGCTNKPQFVCENVPRPQPDAQTIPQGQ